MEPPFNDSEIIQEIFRITKHGISPIKDLDSLLDKILTESRKFTHADAGSIYLLENNRLKFSYVQNNTLFKSITNNKYLYSNHELNINENSIAGYVALNGQTLLIDDAYTIGENVPYSFNSSFDKEAHYLTKSMLVIPLKNYQNKVLGVLQLINSMDSENKPATFTSRHKIMAELFANEAANAIEQAQLTRSIILRMIKMAELRDPKETGAHVNRVASYSIEIYHNLALNQGTPIDKIKQYKDLFRLASMLHDVGKIAISDTILKKPAKLTPEEFNTMKYHTIAGYKLFEDSVSELDQLSAEISLNHHEKWDGSGYPGNNILLDPTKSEWNEGKKGEEIPLSGRIVALSDVYDALFSARSYKKAWSEDEVLTHIKEQSGKHFDPKIVNAFFEIYDVIKAIQNKWNGS